MVLVLLLSACSGDDDAGTAMPGTDQRPPSDPMMIGAWIDGGAYLRWDCEPARHPAATPSPHGDNRICWNTTVTEARGGSGMWPAGATAVKEQYDGAGVLGSISLTTRTTDAESPAAWFYWRRAGGVVSHATAGEAFCSGCHADAPRDFVWSDGS